MKTPTKWLGILLICATAIQAQTIVPRIGAVYTNDLKKIGFVGGVEIGYNFDEMVNANIAFAMQRTGERETTRSDTFLVNSIPEYRVDVNVCESYSVYPIKGGLRVRLPLGGAVLPTVSGALGYVFHNYTVAADTMEIWRAENLYHGLFWDAGLGVDWKLGGRSSLLCTVYYQQAEPKNKNDYARNLRGIRTEIGLLLEF